MAFSAGTFSLYTPGNPVVTGTTIASTWANNTLSDIATGLTTCVLKDGTQTITANIPMSSFKFTGLAVGTAATDSATAGQIPLGNNFRLSLTSATPVTTADVTGATTIYCVPYDGNRIALFDGTNWITRSSAEFSLALGTLTSGLPYDVFCYANGTVPTLEFLAWTNTTTRATALAYQNGVLSQTGNLTRRYLGTFYTTSTTQTEDSMAKRFLWNYYNRVGRPMRITDLTNSWAYTSATLRQANNSTANQLDMVIGVSEDIVSAIARHTFDADAASTVSMGIGLDSTTARATGNYWGDYNTSTSSYIKFMYSTYDGFPGIGRHYLTWLESGGTGGDFYGDIQSLNGISGEVRG